MNAGCYYYYYYYYCSQSHYCTSATKRTQTRLGDRSFSVAGPCHWNSLPVALRDRDISLVQFKRLEDTLVCAGLRRIVTVAFFAPCTNILTELTVILADD